ncbi:MAG: cation:proton antiporter [Fimbriimonadaceae bacterium]|nr:MAG: cation:proton antiporter [Fimbriimonadaceae bacterium]
MNTGWGMILDLLIALSAALLLGLIFERLKISSIIGYLLAGAAVGQGGFGLVQENEQVKVIAEIGVALLLFTIGLEFSWRSLKRLGSGILFGGAAMVLACVIVFTGVGAAFGLSLQAAFVLGAAGSLSSTAVVMRVLRNRNDLDSVHGKTALGVLLIQDIAVVPLVLAVTFVASGSNRIAQEVTQAIMGAIFLVVVLIIFVSQVVPRLLHEKVVAQNRELPIILAVVTCVGATWAAHELKLSPALGAFFAGMLLADSKFSDQMRSDMLPLRTLFVTIFFVSVGLLADLTWMAMHLHWVLGATIVVLLVKAVATYFALRPFVRGIIEVMATAITLSQIGEFSFVLLSIGEQGGLLTKDVFQLVISTTLVTLVVTPFTVAHALPFARSIAKRIFPARKLARSEREARPNVMSGHLVIIGYGEAGQAACSVIASVDWPKLVIDLDPKLVRLAESCGHRAIIGDASSIELLEIAGVPTAKAVIVTISDHTACRMAVSMCKQLAPQVPVISRSRYHIYAEELDMVGADQVVDEEMLVGRRVGKKAVDLLHLEERATPTEQLKWDSDQPYA